MATIIRCPACNREVRLPDELLGQDVLCPVCQHTFQATAITGSAPPLPSARSEPAPAHDDYEREPPRRPREWSDDADDDYGYGRMRRDMPMRTEAAVSAVYGPAIALMITGGLAIGLSVLGLVLNLAVAGAANQPRGPRGDAMLDLAGGLVGAVVGIVWGGVVLGGAAQMKNLRNYGFAMAAAIVAMLPCHGCCLLGLPFGIWALVVLVKSEVKDAFQ